MFELIIGENLSLQKTNLLFTQDQSRKKPFSVCLAHCSSTLSPGNLLKKNNSLITKITDLATNIKLRLRKKKKFSAERKDIQQIPLSTTLTTNQVLDCSLIALLPSV